MSEGVVAIVLVVWVIVSCFVFSVVNNSRKYRQTTEPTPFTTRTINAVTPSALKITHDNTPPITQVIKMTMNPEATVMFTVSKKSYPDQELQSQAKIPTQSHTLDPNPAPQKNNNTAQDLNKSTHTLNPNVSVNSSYEKTQTGIAVSTPKPIDLFDPNKAIICHTFSPGRFGNHLFEYASILGIAAKTNKSAYFVNDNILRSALKYLPVVPEERRPQLKERCRQAKHIADKMPCMFDKSLLSLQPGVDYNIGVYLQSWWYFDGFQEEIRKAVTFTDDIVRNATMLVKLLRQIFPNKTLVGIHNRRGDLLKPSFASQGYMTAPADFFQRAMTYFRERFSPVKFIVSGDDKEWDFENIHSVNNDVIHLVGNSGVMDMQILSLTDHMIRTVGTFGWWAAYKMSGRPTVVNLKEFGRGEQRKFYSPTADDYMLPGWILM